MRLRFADLIVLSLLIVLLSGVFVAAQKAANELDNRKKCASNLRQIGQAILLYGNENRGVYPRTRYVVGDKPVWGTPYEGNAKGAAPETADPFAGDYTTDANDVTAALYLLMRTQDVTSAQFVCPSTAASKFDFGGGKNHALHWTNWPGKQAIRKHLSYSYQNPYPSKDAVAAGFKLNFAISAEFVVLADMNPGTDALLKLTPNSNKADMRHGNSLNHAREGQLVLFGDGHVQFVDNPFVGVQRDNIYTYGKIDAAKQIGGAGIIGSSVDANDSILLPTARDVGMIDDKGNVAAEASFAAITPADAETLRAKLVGKYTGAAHEQLPRLEITGDKIIASGGAIVVTYGYELSARAGDLLRVTLSAPESDPEPVSLSIDGDTITITGSPFLEGQWKKK
jgi:hypothetical protein